MAVVSPTAAITPRTPQASDANLDQRMAMATAGGHLKHGRKRSDSDSAGDATTATLDMKAMSEPMPSSPGNDFRNHKKKGTTLNLKVEIVGIPSRPTETQDDQCLDKMREIQFPDDSKEH